MDTILLLILTSCALVAIPGPNVALIVANALAHGFRYGALTVLGTTLGIAGQLALVMAGLTSVLEQAASLMIWVKWAGIAYLCFLAIQAWRTRPPALDAHDAPPRALGAVFSQGVMLALINPKTLLFNAAFLPQFLSNGTGSISLWGIAGIYLSVLFIGDMAWAFGAHRARIFLARYEQWRGKLTALVLGAAAAAMAGSGDR